MNLTLYGVEIWSTALLFGRIGGMIMLLPGFGEPSVPGRIRLAFALAVAIALGPALASNVPPPADSAMGMAFQVGA